MSFCTVINCMDGRVQEPVIAYLKERYGVDYVDSITEPGPNGILADGSNSELIQSIKDRLKISVEMHNSVGLAVVGHHGCAGNPVEYDKQIAHLEGSLTFLQELYPGLPIVSLWVGSDWNVTEIAAIDPQMACSE